MGMAERDKAERRVTDGGRELRKLINASGMSVPDWCEAHDVERIQVQRVLNGAYWRRITVDFAHQIEVATSGKIRWSKFLSATARAPAQSRAA